MQILTALPIRAHNKLDQWRKASKPSLNWALVSRSSVTEISVGLACLSQIFCWESICPEFNTSLCGTWEVIGLAKRNSFQLSYRFLRTLM